MKTRGIRVLFFLICFVFSYNFVLSYVRAATVGLQVSNTLFDLELLPGTSAKGSVMVTNQSSVSPLPVRISLLLWNLKEDSDDIEFVNSSEELNAAKWFQLEGGEDNILKPGENRDIHFLIAVPKTASLGSYFVMMKFQAVLPGAYINEGSSAAIPEIGSLFFIKIGQLNLNNTTDQYSAKLVSLVLTSRNQKVKTIREALIPKANAGFFDSAIQKLDMKILNNGLYHFKSDGFVEIKNWYGGVVSKVPLPAKYLLPNKTRTIEVPMESQNTNTEIPGFLTGLWNSLYATLYENTYFGPYAAVLHLNIPGRNPLVTQVSFWVVPWKFWAPAIFILLGFSFFMVRFRKRFILAFKALLAKPRRNGTLN